MYSFHTTRHNNIHEDHDSCASEHYASVSNCVIQMNLSRHPPHLGFIFSFMQKTLTMHTQEPLSKWNSCDCVLWVHAGLLCSGSRSKSRGRKQIVGGLSTGAPSGAR